MIGAELLLRSILNFGVDKIFTLSGNQIMPIYDAAIDLGIEMVHCRHEAGAVFMADGYAQSSGKIGVALVTAAPGFTNSLGPLFAINSNQSPVLLLSGDSPINQKNMMAFQELDQPNISKGLVKKSLRIEKTECIGKEIAEAIKTARSGRPGPVHIAIPFDILNQEVKKIDIPDVKDYNTFTKNFSAKAKDNLFSEIKKSTMPIIITSPSLSQSRNRDLYKDLFNTINIPVITMASPRGSNDPTNGRLKEILIKADLIIFIDKDIDFTVGFGSNVRLGAKKIIFLADQDLTIEHAKKMLKERILLSYNVDPICAMNSMCELDYKCNLDWVDLVYKLINDRPPIPKSRSSKLSPSKLCELVIKETLSENTLFFSDGGEFGQWAQSKIPRSNMFTNGLSGAIGGATPQAIGASFANPGKTIVSFMGDGTSGFQIAEWETARRYNLPIIFVIGNDRRWGAEVEIQIRDYGNDRAKFCYLDEITRYDIIAKGLGCDGLYIKTEDELVKALINSMLSKKTTVLDVLMEGLPAPEF